MPAGEKRQAISRRFTGGDEGDGAPKGPTGLYRVEEPWTRSGGSVLVVIARKYSTPHSHFLTSAPQKVISRILGFAGALVPWIIRVIATARNPVAMDLAAMFFHRQAVHRRRTCGASSGRGWKSARWSPGTRARAGGNDLAHRLGLLLYRHRLRNEPCPGSLCPPAAIVVVTLSSFCPSCGYVHSSIHLAAPGAMSGRAGAEVFAYRLHGIWRDMDPGAWFASAVDADCRNTGLRASGGRYSPWIMMALNGVRKALHDLVCGAGTVPGAADAIAAG